MSRKKNSETVYTEEFVGMMSEAAGASKILSSKFLNAFSDSVCNCIESGKKVQLTGFGSFELKTRKSKIGRNLRTGEEIEIPDRKIVVFEAGKKLRDSVPK